MLKDEKFIELMKIVHRKSDKIFFEIDQNIKGLSYQYNHMILGSKP